MVNIKKNAAVLRLRAANFARDSEHRSVGQSCDWPLCCPMSLQRKAQSTHIDFCSQKNRLLHKRL
jgi:hypothetical protein